MVFVNSRIFKFNLKSNKYFKLARFLSLVTLCLILLTSCASDRLIFQPDQLTGNILIWHPFEKKVVQSINQSFQEFQNLNPEVNIQSEYIPQEKLAPEFIQQSLNGYGASAIIDFARTIVELIQSKRIQSLETTDINLSAFNASVLKQVSYQGKLYGVPLGSSTRVLCYNQAKLENSKDPILSQPPTTLEELLQRARKGYSVGMMSSFEDTFWGMGSFGGSLINAQDKIEPQLAGWAEWIQWLQKAINQPNFIVLRANRTVLHQAFATGKLAYYVCNSAEIADLKTRLKDNLKIAVLPGQGSFRAAPLLYTRAIMINRSASHNEKQLVLDLANFLSNPEQQLQSVVQTQSFIPTNHRVFLDKYLSPLEFVLLEQAKTSVAMSLDNLKQVIPIVKKAEPLYQLAIAGEITPEEAAQQLTLFITNQIQISGQ